MQTYGYSMIPTNGEVVPVLMPFTEADTKNTIQRGSRSYSVVEIIREVFKADFYAEIQMYMDAHPNETSKAIQEPQAAGFQLIRLNEPRVESSLRLPACLHHNSRSGIQGGS